MNAAVMIQSCPGEEVLAAFIDQRLDPASRLEVVKHLAECGDCRDMVVAANEYQIAEGAESGEVVRGSFGRRKWVPLAAAAALVGVLFGVPSIRERIFPKSPMAQLIEAANGLPKRPIAARLSVAFPHKQHSNPRGNNEDESLAKLQIEVVASTAIERAEKRPTPSNLHAAGIVRLFLDPTQRDAAVRDLEDAAKKNPESAAILNDLAAAYIARAAKGDYERARAVATTAWNIGQLPAAAWNIALALEYSGHDDAAAIAAWQQYLAIDRDPNSPWATEARSNLQRLQELQQLRRP